MKEKEFERLLSICRIRLSDSEKEQMKKEINEVLAYFDRIERIKCDLEPAYHPIDLPEQLREDVVIDFDGIDLILKNAKTYRFYIVGPKI